jgi:dihydroorotase
MPIKIHAETRRMTQEEFGRVAYDVMKCVFGLHNEMGRFFHEDVYRAGILRRITAAKKQVQIEVRFLDFRKDYFMDLVVHGGAVFELKAVEKLTDQHRSQLMNYLLLAELQHGKLINLRPDLVEHEFVNALLTREQRTDFVVCDAEWEDLGHWRPDLKDLVLRTNVLIVDDRIAAVDAADHAAADEVVSAAGLASAAGRDRRPGPFPRTRLDAQGGSPARFARLRQRRRDDVSGDAQHRAERHHQQRLNEKLELASRKSLVNYGFYIGATPQNLTICGPPSARRGSRSSSAPARAICWWTTRRRWSGSSPRRRCRSRRTARTKRPSARTSSDWPITRRGRAFPNPRSSGGRDRHAPRVDLARRHQHRFHVLHVSTGAEVELFADHGGLLTAEVCPHHLFFNVDDYPRLGSLIQMNPSIKTREDNRQLWQALLDGRIQVIATDHAPHTLEEKQQPYPQSPSGLPAVENSLALLLDQVNRGRCTLQQVVHWMSDAPARVWDLVDKGRIQDGYDADLVLVDMQRVAEIRNETQQTKCGWSPVARRVAAGLAGAHLGDGPRSLPGRPLRRIGPRPRSDLRPRPRRILEQHVARMIHQPQGVSPMPLTLQRQRREPSGITVGKPGGLRRSAKKNAPYGSRVSGIGR